MRTILCLTALAFCASPTHADPVPSPAPCILRTLVNGAIFPRGAAEQFNAPRSGAWHSGVDIIATQPGPIRAVRDGNRGLYAGEGPEGGWCAEVYNEAAHTADIYCGIGTFRHIDVTAPVKQGDILGWPLRRADGRYITHFEIRQWNDASADMRAVDPTNILRQINGCR